MTTAARLFRKDGNGEAWVYRLSEPVTYSTLTERSATTEYVWVSAVDDEIPAIGYRLHETYIFPCDADGNVLDWGELGGSYKGGTDHDEAIRRAGWEVAS